MAGGGAKRRQEDRARMERNNRELEDAEWVGLGA